MKLHWLLFLLACLPNWLYAAESHEELNQFLQSLQTMYAQFNQKIDMNGQSASPKVIYIASYF